MLHCIYELEDWIFSSEVEKKILSLPNGLLARYLRLTDLMLEFGSNLGMPHTRSLGDGLFELRVKGKEGIARVFFLYNCRKTNNYASRFY